MATLLNNAVALTNPCIWSLSDKKGSFFPIGTTPSKYSCANIEICQNGFHGNKSIDLPPAVMMYLQG